MSTYDQLSFRHYLGIGEMIMHIDVYWWPRVRLPVFHIQMASTAQHRSAKYGIFVEIC